MEGEGKALAGYNVRELLGHKRRVCTLGWSGNGKKLASGSADQSIRVWTIEPHGQVSRPERAETELKGHTGTISHLAWKPGNQSDVLVSVTAGDKSDKSIRLWDVRANKASGVVPTSTGNLFVTWCPDGSSVAVINTDNTLSIVDVRKAKVVKTHRFQQEIYEISWGPSPSHFMVATEKGAVEILSFPNLEPLWTLRGHSSTAYCFSCSRNNKWLASGGGDAVLSLWDLDEMVCVRSWYHIDNPVRSVSMSADGRYIAYASEAGELEVLSTTGGERLAELRLRTQFSDSVAWNPVHNVLAYCDEVQDPTSRDRSMVGVISVFAGPKHSS